MASSARQNTSDKASPARLNKFFFSSAGVDAVAAVRAVAVAEYGEGDAGISKFMESVGLSGLGADFSLCRCRLHNYKEPTGITQGCVQRAVRPSVGPVRAAFDNVHHACGAHPDVRAADYRMVKFAVTLLFGTWTPNEEEWQQVSSSFVTTTDYTAEAFGRGYCHLGINDGRVRYRVARLTGAYAYLMLVFALGLLTIRERGAAFKLVEVSPGFFHMSKDKSVKGATSEAVSKVMTAIAEAIVANPVARVGGAPGDWVDESDTESSSSVVFSVVPAVEPGAAVRDLTFGDFGGAGVYGFPEPSVAESKTESFAMNVRSPKVIKLLGLLKSCGVDMPKRSLYALAAATHAKPALPSFFLKEAQNLRVYENIGDSAMRVVAGSFGVASGMSVSEVAKMIASTQSDVALAAAAVNSEVALCFSLGSAADLSTVTASVLEAVIGVISLYRPVSAVARFMGFLKLVVSPEDWEKRQSQRRAKARQASKKTRVESTSLAENDLVTAFLAGMRAVRDAS